MDAKIFYCLCDLFNEGRTTTDEAAAPVVIEAARLVFPGSTICAGAYDSDTNARALYVDDYKPNK